MWLGQPPPSPEGTDPNPFLFVPRLNPPMHHDGKPMIHHPTPIRHHQIHQDPRRFHQSGGGAILPAAFFLVRDSYQRPQGPPPPPLHLSHPQQQYLLGTPSPPSTSTTTSDLSSRCGHDRLARDYPSRNDQLRDRNLSGGSSSNSSYGFQSNGDDLLRTPVNFREDLQISDQDLVTLGTKELNRLLKKRGVTSERKKRIKEERRTLKNRGYAANCRVKREEEEAMLKRRLVEQERRIAELREENRRKVDQRLELGSVARNVVRNILRLQDSLPGNTSLRRRHDHELRALVESLRTKLDIDKEMEDLLEDLQRYC